MRSLILVLISAKRLKSQTWLSLVLLVSAALAIAVVACVPVFADAVSRRILQEELGLTGKALRRSPFTIRFLASPSPGRPVGIADAGRLRDTLAGLLAWRVGVPIVASYTEVHSPRYQLIATTAPKEGATPSYVDGAYAVYAERAENHIRVVAGAPFGEGADAAVLPVWVNRDYAIERGLQVGELYELGNVFDPTSQRIPVRIAGLWVQQDPNADFWWYTEPIWHYACILLTSRQAYEAVVETALPSKSKFVSWRYVLQDSRVNLSRADHYLEGLATVKREAERLLPGGGMGEAPTTGLTRGQQRKTALSLVLLGFSIPLIVIIIYFMVAVSTMLVRFQSQEIATLISRGSGRLQIVGLAALETLLILLMATPLGLALGLLLARLLGYSFSFLRFVSRAPLNVSITSVEWWLVAIVMGVTLLARIVPAWSAAKTTIVIQERQSARGQFAVGAARWLLVGFLTAATIYAYQRLQTVGSLSLVSWRPGERDHDPLLLVAPSLFLLTAPALLSLLFVVLIRPLAWLGRLSSSVSAYLGCVNLGREGGHYRTPVYMLVLCLSIGVFFASLGKSADAWLVDRRRYEIGADLTFRPRVNEEGGRRISVAEALSLEEGLSLPAGDYEQLEGIEAAMPVGEYRAAVEGGSVAAYGRLLAIDRLRFPEIAYFRPDYSSVSLGELMNRLGAQREALLMPRETAEALQLSEGDRVRLNVVIGESQSASFEFVLAGTFDYFPTMFKDKGLVFVANLDFLETETAGLLLHNLWMRTAPGIDSSQVATDVVRLSRQALRVTGDLPTLLAYDQTRLERVGLFGLLSVSFAAGALLAALGLLVHSAASMRVRSLHFAVLQALGLGRNQVILTVFVEYALVLLYSLIAGTVLGLVGARLYVPFYQLVDVRGVPVPPYIVLIDVERGVLLAGLMAIALVLAEGMVVLRVIRTRMFESLRMGVRE